MDPAPLFVYGSLLFPDVLRVLIDRDPTRQPATAPGWQVIALPGRLYPGLIPNPGATASGDIFTDLTPGEWCALDAFEADVYALTSLTLTTGRSALAYTCTEPPETDAAWDPAAFARHHLTGYLERCAAWRQHYDESH